MVLNVFGFLHGLLADLLHLFVLLCEGLGLLLGLFKVFGEYGKLVDFLGYVFLEEIYFQILLLLDLDLLLLYFSDIGLDPVSDLHHEGGALGVCSLDFQEALQVLVNPASSKALFLDLVPLNEWKLLGVAF